MLINTVDTNGNRTNTVHTNWQNELRNFGYPQQTRNIALSNASHCASSQGLVSNQELVTVAGNGGTSDLTSLLMFVLLPFDPLIGVVLNDVSTTLLGFLPGNSSLDLEFRANAFPSSGTARIYKGRLTYKKTFLWLVPITRTIFNNSENSQSGDKFIDNYPGGVTPNALAIAEGGNSNNWFYNYDYTLNVNLNFNFISATSALDVGSDNATLINDNYFATYTAANPPVANASIPFANFTTTFNAGGTNEPHISFNRRNGDWLATELDEDLTNQGIFNCSFICASNKILGAATICNSEIYAAPTGATTYNWTITQGASLVTLSGNGTPNITLTSANAGSGFVTMRVTLGDERCGSISLTRRVYTGLPSFNMLTYQCAPSLCINPQSDSTFLISVPTQLNTKNKITARFTGLSTAETGLNTNWEWEEVAGNNLLSLSGSNNNRTICPIAAGQTILRVRAQNACGWSDWVELPITVIQLPSSPLNRIALAQNTISIKNAIADNEDEPAATPQYAWATDNIWIRNAQDGLTEHQNPLYNANVPNYVYVRLRNSGCRATTGGLSLKTYWAKASTSLNWPQSWNTATYNDTDTKLGNLIGTTVIPELQPEQEITLSMPFTIPDPARYNDIFPELWRFGLLARAVPESDELAPQETQDLVQTVVNNENIAWKNITIVNCVNDTSGNQSIGGVIAVGNTFNTSKSFYLELIKEDLETGKPIYDEAEVTLKMDDVLYQAWVRGGKNAMRLDNTLDEKIMLIKGNNVFLKDLQFNANETGTLYLKFNFLTQEITEKSKYVYHVIQKETATNNIIGGETYVIKKQDRPFFMADAGDTKYVDKNEPITISAAQINEQAIYNWYDSDGNLVATGQDLSIATDIATKFKLEIIAADGFKDYTEVEVKLKPNSLGIIAPNPAINTVSISYKLNEVSSAYLIILGSYGTTGTSSNYILDLNTTQTNINLDNYQNGFYTVALVCNGQIVDAKTLVKQ